MWLRSAGGWRGKTRPPVAPCRSRDDQRAMPGASIRRAPARADSNGPDHTDRDRRDQPAAGFSARVNRAALRVASPHDLALVEYTHGHSGARRPSRPGWRGCERQVCVKADVSRRGTDRIKRTRSLRTAWGDGAPTAHGAEWGPGRVEKSKRRCAFFRGERPSAGTHTCRSRPLERQRKRQSQD
jgi:hypothetical protein